MKKLFMLLAVCLSAALFLAGCSSFGIIRGSGNAVTKEFDFKDFTRIELSSAFHFDITRSDAYSVVVSTDDNIVSRLDLSQSGKTLTVKLKPASYSNAETKATIALPELEKLNISGAAQGKVRGFQSSGDFDLEASGASRVEIDMETGDTFLLASGASQISGQIKAQDLEIETSGASRCEISGTAGKTRYNISGASQAITGSLQLQSADVEVSGASKAVVNTNGTLDLDLTGASRLEYYGSPTMGKVNVNGASTLTRK
jgi:hypothetical protein